MENSVIMYQEWAKKVQKILKETDIDWEKQYSNYAKKIIKNIVKVEKNKKSFRVPSQFECFLTLGNAVKGKAMYDLRYYGQSVGQVQVDEDGNARLIVDENKSLSNEKYFGYETYFSFYASDRNGIIDEPWSKGKKAKLFRKFFKEEVDKQKMPHSIEHLVETRLYQELGKKRRFDKQIVDIQPIRLGKILTHMKTAVKASSSKIGVVSVSERGGEIDIFCRRRVNPKESILTVIEVKDKEEKGESFNEAMKQAVSYAVFIRELIRSSCGKEWMKIWGINDEKLDSITINAVVAIPAEGGSTPDFWGQSIFLDEDKIKLHYMAIDKSILDPNGEVRIETKI